MQGLLLWQPNTEAVRGVCFRGNAQLWAPIGSRLCGALTKQLTRMQPSLLCCSAAADAATHQSCNSSGRSMALLSYGHHKGSRWSCLTLRSLCLASSLPVVLIYLANSRTCCPWCTILAGNRPVAIADVGYQGRCVSTLGCRMAQHTWCGRSTAAQHTQMRPGQPVVGRSQTGHASAAVNTRDRRLEKANKPCFSESQQHCLCHTS